MSRVQHAAPPVTRLTLLSLLAACAGKDGGDIDYGDCLDYIACSEAVGDPTATITAEFGEEGTCWDDAEDEQTLCRAYCTDAVDLLAEAYPDVEECGGGSSGPEPDCAEGLEGTGYSEGDVAYDFTRNDQEGNAVSLYDYCDDAVVLIIGSTWDPGTSAAAADAVDWLEAYGEQGLTVLVLLGENDDYDTPSTSDLASWAAEHDLDTPVLADPNYEIGYLYDGDGVFAFPFLILLKPGAELVLVGEFTLSTDDIESALP